MAREKARRDRETALRSSWAEGICPDDALVQGAFEGPTRVATNLILKLTGPLAVCEMLDNGSRVADPSVDFALQTAGDTSLDVYVCLPKYNKLRGAMHPDSQPPTHLVDTISTVKSPQVHTDGDSL